MANAKGSSMKLPKGKPQPSWKAIKQIGKKGKKPKPHYRGISVTELYKD